MFFDAMNLAILVGSALVVAAAFTSILSFRFGAPLLLVFLLVGLIAGEDGIGIPFNDLSAAIFIGAVALAIILFDAGYATRLSTLRLAAAPALVLASAGVLLTAVMVGAVADLLFHFDFLQGLLLGIIVATDRCGGRVFPAQCRRPHPPRPGALDARDRIRSNDPLAIFLTLAVVGLLAGGAAPGWALAGELAAQLGVGLAGGLLGGTAIIQIVRRTEFDPAL
jgi:cell volume regulation protein A